MSLRKKGNDMSESKLSALAGEAISAGLNKTAMFPVPRAARAWLTQQSKRRGVLGTAARFARGSTVPLTTGSAAGALAPVALGVGQTYAVHRMTKNMHEDMKRRQEDMEKQAFIPAPRALRRALARAARSPGALPKGTPPTGPTLGLGPAGGANRPMWRRAAGYVRGLTGPATAKTIGAASAPFIVGHLQGKAVDHISNKTFLKNKTQEEDR